MADHIQIGAVSPRIQYTGDGSQTAFSFPFPIFSNSDLEVFANDESLILDTDYLVEGAGESLGGTVTFASPPTNGVVVTLRRRLTVKRTSDFQESGTFRAKTINDELDYQTAVLQQLEDDLDRTLRLVTTDSGPVAALPAKADRAGKYLGFDGNGDPLAAEGTEGIAASAALSPFLQSASIAAARSEPGLADPAVHSYASQAEAEAGAEAAKVMSPLRTAQAIAALGAGSDHLARTQTLLNKLDILILASFASGMADGAADPFETDTIGGTSTNETYNAAGDYYHNPGGYTADNTSGQTFTASSEDGGDGIPNEAFDDNTSNYFQFATTTGWIKIQYGSAKTNTKMTYRARPTSDQRGPTSMTIEGSNTGSFSGEQTVLYTLSGGSSWGTPGEQRTYTWSNTTAFTYYRINITASSGAGTYLNASEIEFMENATPLDMTLVSASALASAAPDSAQIVVLYKDDDGGSVVGTDFMAEVSRDGGTTWTAATMTDRGAWIAPDAATYRILDGVADISGQPSGTSMKYQIKTLNNKAQRVRGVARMWG